MKRLISACNRLYFWPAEKLCYFDLQNRPDAISAMNQTVDSCVWERAYRGDACNGNYGRIKVTREICM